VDAYGAYSESLSSEMIKRLKVDSKTDHGPTDEASTAHKDKLPK
jgi:hypothetical protein